MEHDIGCKIKAARIEKKLTQEQVAELLGVSRQTISNWENEKSYPDIISVIKMSECYDVSLDYLLKGEQKMKSYYDYLEEITNVVALTDTKAVCKYVIIDNKIAANKVIADPEFTKTMPSSVTAATAMGCSSYGQMTAGG